MNVIFNCVIKPILNKAGKKDKTALVVFVKPHMTKHESQKQNKTMLTFLKLLWGRMELSQIHCACCYDVLL